MKVLFSRLPSSLRKVHAASKGERLNKTQGEGNDIRFPICEITMLVPRRVNDERQRLRT